MKESSLQSKILNDLRSFGKYCECFKIMKTSDNGEPDVFFTTKITGAVLIEIKRPDGSTQKIQSAKIKKLNECGTQAYICYSWENWASLKNDLGLSLATLSK